MYFCIMIRQKGFRYAMTLVLFLFAIHVMGKRDSLLWVGVKNVSAEFQAGAIDSAMVNAQRLLVISEKQNDALALSQLHSLIGFCLREKGQEDRAMKEMEQCVAIGETNLFLQKAAKAKHSLYYTIMLPAYSMLSTYYYKKGETQGTLYAKKGMEWIASCKDAQLRAVSMSVFSEVLMAQREYRIIYEPLKQAVADALKENQPDLALAMTAYLVEIEHQVLHRDSADIPWIKVGNDLLAHAKTEHSKTLFLSAVNMNPWKTKELTDNGKVHANHKLDTAVDNQALADQTHLGTTRIEYVQVRNQRIIIIVAILGILLFLFLCYTLWQRRLRNKKDKETELQIKESYLEGLEDERSRLARELHDGVSNQLLAVEMKLNSDGLTEQTLQLLNESREQVRRFSHELMPPEFELATLDEILAHYTSQLNGIHGCHITYQSLPTDADWTAIPHSKAYELYRMVQETVTNVLKHSEATELTVLMTLENNTVTITVQDNGHATSVKPTKGIGLRTIQQRAETIGAIISEEKTTEVRKTMIQLTL